MQKMRGVLITGLLVLLLCGIVVAGEMDPVTTTPNLSVIVSPPANGGDTFYVGETVSFSGVNHISNKTYVRVVNYILRDDDPRLIIDVIDGRWSGSFVHTNPDRSGRSQFVIRPYSDNDASQPAEYLASFGYFRGYPGPRPTPKPTPSPTINDDLFTLKINGVNYQNLNNPSFTWGDTIRFSGTNNVSEKNSVYLMLGDPADNVDWEPPRKCDSLQWTVVHSSHVQRKTTSGYGAWSYSWNTGDEVCKYPNIDTVISLELMDVGNIKVPITMKAKIIPTPTPTPDYAAQIAALQTQVSAQATQIRAQATQIQQIAEKTPVPTAIPTTVPTTVITTKTPVPTQTPDYEATLAAIQKQIDQQNDIIYQILHFLGLR